MLTTLQQSGSPVPKVQPVPKDTKASSQDRPWIKVRLSTGSHDVERIVANWRAERAAAPNLAAAIRLYDAVLRGDLDQARQACPALGLVLGVPGQTRKRQSDPPVLDSDSESRSDSEGDAVKPIEEALCEITGSDIHINHRTVANLAHKLAGAGYTPDDIHTWYSGWWRVHDWRGRKEERPKLKDVQELIGRVRDLPPLSGQTVASTQEGMPAEAGKETNPYLQDEYFRRPREESTESPSTESSGEPPVVEQPKAVSEWSAQRWQATMGHFEISLGRATYECHLGGIRLIDVLKHDDGEVFVVTVPHKYAKDWIERHFLPSLEQTLSDWNRKPTRVQIEVSSSPAEPPRLSAPVQGSYRPVAAGRRWLSAG